MNKSSYPLFSRFGVEIEYMVVDQATLNISPTVDEILFHFGHGPTSEVEFDQATWSNELVRHVLEFKVNEPVTRLEDAVPIFQDQVHRANGWLHEQGRMLLPTGMHPWMDPKHETHLWPFEGHEIYDAFDRVFGCQGHGWSNLQSVHLNLPYASEAEFVQLHAAIRLLLPLIPALSASTPFQEGRHLGFKDQRLESYRTNARRFACISGQVVPEPFDSYASYREGVFQPIERSLNPLDPDGIFEAEWVNARGAIARLSRGSIEVRVIDTQECPLADLAILNLVVEGLKWLIEDSGYSPEAFNAYPQDALVNLFQVVAREAEGALLEDRAYQQMLGLEAQGPIYASNFWRKIFEKRISRHSLFYSTLSGILNHGSLAKRLLEASGTSFEKQSCNQLYRRISNSLQRGIPFGFPGIEEV